MARNQSSKFGSNTFHVGCLVTEESDCRFYIGYTLKVIKAFIDSYFRQLPYVCSEPA